MHLLLKQIEPVPHASPSAFFVLMTSPLGPQASVVHGSSSSSGTSAVSISLFARRPMPSHVFVLQSPVLCFDSGAGPAGTSFSEHLCAATSQLPKLQSPSKNLQSASEWHWHSAVNLMRSRWHRSFRQTARVHASPSVSKCAQS